MVICILKLIWRSGVQFVLPPSCPKSDIFSAGIVLVELLMAGVAGDGPTWTLGE